MEWEASSFVHVLWLHDDSINRRIKSIEELSRSIAKFCFSLVEDSFKLNFEQNREDTCCKQIKRTWMKS